MENWRRYVLPRFASLSCEAAPHSAIVGVRRTLVGVASCSTIIGGSFVRSSLVRPPSPAARKWKRETCFFGGDRRADGTGGERRGGGEEEVAVAAAALSLSSLGAGSWELLSLLALSLALLLSHGGAIE